jgi:hypothetical protein
VAPKSSLARCSRRTKAERTLSRRSRSPLVAMTSCWARRRRPTAGWSPSGGISIHARTSAREPCAAAVDGASTALNLLLVRMIRPGCAGSSGCGWQAERPDSISSLRDLVGEDGHEESFGDGVGAAESFAGTAGAHAGPRRAAPVDSWSARSPWAGCVSWRWVSERCVCESSGTGEFRRRWRRSPRGGVPRLSFPAAEGGRRRRPPGRPPHGTPEPYNMQWNSRDGIITSCPWDVGASSRTTRGSCCASPTILACDCGTLLRRAA